jgi:predicted permease
MHAQSAADEPRWLAAAQLLTAPIRYDDTAREPAEAQIARWMAAIAALLLVVTCATVANLLLVRLAERRRELAIRQSLGSGRWRVLQLVGCEVALLVAVAGVVSAWIARLAFAASAHALFPDGVNWSAALDRRTYGWLLVLLAGGGAAIAALLAWAATRQPASEMLRARDDTGHTRLRARGVLIVLQAAFSTVLLAGAGLFAISWWHIDGVDLGTEPGHVIVAELRLPHPPVPGGGAEFRRFLEDLRGREQQAYAQALASVRTLPGVASASLTLGLPFDNGSFSTSLALPGHDPIVPAPGGGPYLSAVGPDYFSTIGTRLVQGRPFDAGDTAASARVAIVGVTTARRLWPAGDAIGQCLTVGNAGGCATIVGIAQDVHRVSLREEPSLQVYVPFGQERDIAGARLIIRADGRSPLPWTVLREAIVRAWPEAQVVELRYLSDALSGELRPARIGMATFGASAGLALLASTFGLYGLMAYVVTSRRREIGIRMALGASRAGIQRVVAGDGLRLAGLGVAVGLSIAAAAAPWIQGQLFETSAADPRALGATALVVLATALAAAALPARRALRVSPAETIRAD